MEQGPRSCPLFQASESSVSRDGFLPGGGQQQQDGWRRRISLSGCFLKITLPLSAGQGCSRLNNHSRPALPCSRALAGSPSPGCIRRMLDHGPFPSIAVPRGRTSHGGHDALHSPPCFPQNPAQELLLVVTPQARIPRAGGVTGGGIGAHEDGAVGRLPKRLTHAVITP